MSTPPPSEQGRFLLPAGLFDLLGPDAAFEAALVEKLIESLTLWGYERVKPPLLEFEETLLAGAGQAVAADTFRVLDPQSHKMLGLRADMTPQVARLAKARLAGRVRPLRLCYAGQVLRVTGSLLRPARQFTQVGAELFGGKLLEADIEIIATALECLLRLGLPEVSLDLSHPRLVGLVCEAFELDEANLRPSLDRKDLAALDGKLTPEAEAALACLLLACGPYDEVRPLLAKTPLPKAVQEELTHLDAVVAALNKLFPELSITLDLVERRGFEYQTGLSFSLYAEGARDEVGRGGRYESNANPNSTLDEEKEQDGETATGFTLFMDSLSASLPPAPARPRVLVSAREGLETAARLRAKGWQVLLSHDGESPLPDQARACACSHFYHQGTIERL